MIDYKGYSAVFEYDESVEAFHGRVVGLRDVVTFEGRSVAELRKEMKASIEDYLEFCAESGRDPEKPYRGEFLVRTSPELHRAAAHEAESEGMSLNAWVERAITSVVREESPAWTEAPRSRKPRRRVRGA